MGFQQLNWRLSSIKHDFSNEQKWTKYVDLTNKHDDFSVKE